MNDDELDFLQWKIELTDKEIFLVGKIIAQWSALEHEVFLQTLRTYEVSNGEEVSLPKQMNNLQFTKVLELWNERVAQKVGGVRQDVLTNQFHRILHYKEYRDSLVHGMWDWSKTDLSNISTIRVRKTEVITTKFTLNDLNDLHSVIAGINFKIRYPGGVEDYARQFEESGSYISRRALSIFSGSSVANDWITLGVQPKKKS